MKRLKWVVFGLVIALVLVPVAVGVRTLTFPQTLTTGQYDCAVVLGAAVSDGRPTPVFQARLDHGVGLYQQQIVNTLIFTGGIGTNDSLAESEVGASYAQEQGIPGQDILLERRSTTTPGNLAGAQWLMQRHNLETAVIVSDPLHLYRSQLLANFLGMNAVTSATPTTRYRSWKTKLPFLIREVYFTLHFKLARGLA